MIVILDVDGVVFRGQFLAHMARRVGPCRLGIVAALCGVFEFGFLSLHRLLQAAYGPWRGREESELWEAYREMPLADGAVETVSALRRNGHFVALVSSGVPRAMVSDLAARLGADRGLGVLPGVKEGRLTGEVAGALSRAGGKVAAVEDLLKEHGADWPDVAAVADDRNNLELFRKCGRAVGFNPTPALRLAARVNAQGPDLRAVFPLIEGEETESPAWRAARELPRKAVHACAVLAPAAMNRWPVAAVAVLLGTSLGFALSEILRRRGKALFPFYYLTAMVMRTREDGFVAAPLYLAAGVLTALFLFPRDAAHAAIGAIALADPIAGLVGSFLPVARLPYSRGKSLGGLCAGLAAGIGGALLYAPTWPVAVVAGAVAAFVESFPIGDSAIIGRSLPRAQPRQ